MILTKEKFNEGMSRNRNWSDAQIECFGITRKNNKGWMKQIIGKDFEPEVFDKFFGLRDKHLKPAGKTISKKTAKKANPKAENITKTLWTVFAYTWFGGKLEFCQPNSKNYEGELSLKK